MKPAHVREPQEGRSCLGRIGSFSELPFIFPTGSFISPSASEKRYSLRDGYSAGNELFPEAYTALLGF